MALVEQKKLHVDDQVFHQPAWVGEYFLLSQAIGNLLDNAIDFTPAGGSITIQAQRFGDSWTLSVANTGSAIPDYAQKRVFERFFSLPRPDTGMKSTGLGLAFVKEVADLHGGSTALQNLISTGGEVTGVEARLTILAASEATHHAGAA